MPFQGVEASYAKLTGHSALLLKKPGTPYIFEILRIRQHSQSNDTYLYTVYFYVAKGIKDRILSGK